MSFELDKVPNINGKIAIVTGANIGLGYEVAKGLATKEAKVIMACRNLAKAAVAKKEIEQAVPQADMEVMRLDLNSLQSVRDFAVVFSSNYDRLDLLIENAGIMVPPFATTEDGFESQMGVNYFGHFLLTNLLFPLIQSTKDSRIITLSSMAHKQGKIDFSNINAEKNYSKMGAYGQSKLACLMFAYELQRRLVSAGEGTIAVSVHPGVSNTNLGQHVPRFLYNLLVPLMSFITHSPENAALPTLMAALDTNVEGGDYYGPTGFNEMKGKPGKVTSMPHSHDLEVASKLWDVSEELTGEKFTISHG